MAAHCQRGSELHLALVGHGLRGRVGLTGSQHPRPCLCDRHALDCEGDGPLPQVSAHVTVLFNIRKLETGTAVRSIERAQDAIGTDLDELVTSSFSRTSLA